MQDGLEKYKMVNTKMYLNGELLLDPTDDLVFMELKAIGDAEKIEECSMLTFIIIAIYTKASGVKKFVADINNNEEATLLSNLTELGVNHAILASSQSTLIEILSQRIGELKYIKLPLPTQEIKDSKDAVTLQSQINLNSPIRLYKTSSTPSIISSIKAINPGITYWIHSSWTSQVDEFKQNEEVKLYPLKLDEPKDIELDPETPKGPLKIKMPNPNETYKVIQTLAEVNAFGEVAQNVVHSDWKGQTCISLKRLKPKIREDNIVTTIDKSAIIAKLRICSMERIRSCHYEHDFQAISKFYVKPNFTFWVPLQTSSSSSSPCDKGCHLMTVTSLVKQLKVKPKLFMFQNQVKFPLTNDTRQNIMIEYGRKLVKTKCCHDYFD